MSTTVDERLAATERRWGGEVETAKRRLENARKEEESAGRRMMATSWDSDEWDDVVRDHFRAIDMRGAAEAALRRISDPGELDRRLKNSEKLARRFGS